MMSFDVQSIELAGRNLIEASAGTGKTYAIAALYLRLLVEKGLAPENILVVTFTEAATKELRDRIRNRISEARDMFAGCGGGDEFLAGLRASPQVAELGEAESLRRLELALRSFDCAAISTIHGFCNRALQENAFESGSLYDTELTADQAGLVQGVVDDYWRMTFFGPDTTLLPLAERRKWSPVFFAGFLKGKLSNPELKLIPRFSAAEISEMETRCQEDYQAVAAIWNRQREEIVQLLNEHNGLSRSEKNYRLDLIPSLVEEMDDYLQAGRVYDCGDSFEKCTAGYIAAQRLKKHDPPEHEFFTACQRLADAIAQKELSLLWGLYEHVRSSLPRWKEQVNIRCYDDLLVDLYRALESGNGEALAGRIRGRFRAALIDEFQDTDQIQYRIFRRVFNDEATPLFLIGDPKQAIYSFRGADIFAYLEARDDIPAKRRFTMEKNWRSTPQLVEAVNALFRRQEARPLFFDDLDYPEVTAARAGQPLALGDRDPAPLQVWFMGRTEQGDKPLDLGKGRERVAATVADEISSLLADGRAGVASLGDKPLEPGDIAVIVRSHPQAGQLHGELLSRGIPAVVRSNASVFASDEASQLCRLLAAIAEPGREGRVRAAMVTPLLGVSGSELAWLLDDKGAAEWERRMELFREYHDLWRGRGFMAMFRAMTAREGVRGRLLALPGGERALTNLLHCAELIHAEESASGAGMEAVRSWFSRQVSRPPEGEEHQIRLESDEKAVRILTIHVSKGLEFPVVFCPFLWGGVHDSEQTVVYHDGFTMVADYGSEQYDEHRSQAMGEALAENLRLLYVALTRAKNRCYLVWGRFKNVESSALAYLLHAPQDVPSDSVLATLAGQMAKISDAAMLAPLRELEGVEKGRMTVTVDPEPVLVNHAWAAEGGAGLSCRTIGHVIESDWRVSSFTSLVEGHREGAELPDRDRGEGAPAVVAPAQAPLGSIFAFPRGARAGTFLHGIFEKVDFCAAGDAAIRALVERQLAQSDFGSQWLDALCIMVRQTLEVPLLGQDVALSRLEPGSWLTEMEFFFPLSLITPPRLAAILVRHGLGGSVNPGGLAESLNFRETRGMLRGFMDLVFRHGGRYYILDWKSNHLGNSPEDYQPERLADEMERKLYPLQYLLYTVALNRYLMQRDPGYRYEEHFGGVIYLFLRGVSAGHSGSGVYFDRPAPALVADLTACLIDLEVA